MISYDNLDQKEVWWSSSVSLLLCISMTHLPGSLLSPSLSLSLCLCLFPPLPLPWPQLWITDINTSLNFVCFCILPGWPCHLYFDLEFLKNANPESDGEKMVELLIQVMMVRRDYTNYNSMRKYTTPLGPHLKSQLFNVMVILVWVYFGHNMCLV